MYMRNLTDSSGYKIPVFSGVELQGCVRYKNKLSDDRAFWTVALKSYIITIIQYKSSPHNLATEYTYPKVYPSKLSEYFLQ